MTQVPASARRPLAAAAGISLLPREHGAYALMAFPQATALLLGGVTVPALLLVAAVVCAFLLHEPVLVILGRRGPRAIQTAGERSKWQAGVLSALGVGCGVFGLLLSSAPLWDAALVAVVLAALVVVFIMSGSEKSLWGEATVALTLAGASVPTAIAGGVTPGRAWPAALVWGAAFLFAMVTVKAIIDRHKKRHRRPSRVLAGAFAGIAAGILVLGRPGGFGAETAVLPASVTSLAVLLSPITPRRLRWLGWSLVVSNTVTLVMLVMLLR